MIHNQLSNIVRNLILLAALTYVATGAAPVYAVAGSTITVTTSADNVTVDGLCSLREAITNANDNAVTHADCTAGSGQDAIIFDAALGSVTIMLGSALPAISDTSGLTINGSGQETLSGNDLYQVFYVNTGVPFTVNTLYISHGRATGAVGAPGYYGGGTGGAGGNGQGACLYNNGGTVSITNSTFDSCSAYGGTGGMGGSPAGHWETVSCGWFCTYQQWVWDTPGGWGGNGGAGYGGAIYLNGGSLNLTDSTFAFSSAWGGTGGYGAYGVLGSGGNGHGGIAYGGAVYIASGTAVITNGTFYSNSVHGLTGYGNDAYGGAINNNGGTLTINNATIASNTSSWVGGGIYNASLTTVKNTILAGNTANASGGNCYNSVSITSAGNNLESLTTCGLTSTGDLSNTNPLLGSGNMMTYPVALTLDSPAINAGNDATCASTDQRGIIRPQGAHCDIGTFEYDVYTLTYNAGDHGSLTGTSPQLVYRGANGAMVTAVATTGYHFTNWSDGVLTASRTDNNVTNNINVTANYTQNEYTLSITSDHGTVTKSPDQVTYHEGDVVQLTAAPATGWSFANWSGDLATSVNPDSITIHGNTSVTANYTQNEYTLSITSNHGTVTKSPDQVTYHEGDVVQLTAAPATGWSFANWSGDLATSVNPDSITIHGNTSVTANYTQNEYTLSITSDHGTVTKSPDQATYHESDIVTLSVTPEAGWTFIGWTPSLTDNQITITGNTTVTASFDRVPSDIALSSANVAENKPIDTPVGTLSTTDLDAGDTFAYSFTCAAPGANDSSFAIVGNSLNTAASFDFEVKKSYAICIRTTDLGGLFFDKNFTVTVTDVNEETAKNGGFNLYPAGKKVPTSWWAIKFAATDGKDMATKKEGSASVKIAGAAGKIKTLTQTLALSGPLGDTITFSYWAKANKFPTAGLCQAQVLFYSGSALKGTKTLKCPAGTTYAWKQAKLSFTAPAAYTKVVIKFTFSKASGTVWFDAVSLIR